MSARADLRALGGLSWREARTSGEAAGPVLGSYMGLLSSGAARVRFPGGSTMNQLSAMPPSPARPLPPLDPRATGAGTGRDAYLLGGLVAVLLGLAVSCVVPETDGDGSDSSPHDVHGESAHDPPGFPRRRRTPPGPTWHASVVGTQEAVLELTVRPGRALLPPNEVLELPVAIDVRARPQAIQRPPLDLSLVFDKSGSMKGGGKIAYTMQAARLLVENLSEQDTVSIVAYDTKVVVLDPQQPVVQKTFLSHWADEIEAGGNTNLSGGLLAGIAEVRRGKRPGAVARVILLTDGLANRGVTSPKKLRGMAQAARREGITVSTIGVGEKFDERVLSGLASAGGGNYSYVSEAEDIPGVVAGEIQGLLPVVCQNLRLSFQISEGVELTGLIGADLQYATSPGEVVLSEDTIIHVGDLIPGESRTIILHLLLSAAPGPAAPLSVLRTRVEFQHVGEAGRPLSQEEELLLAVAASRRESEGSVDMAVMDTAWLAEVLDLTYLALQSRDWDLVDQAHRTIETYRKELEGLAVQGDSETLREHAALLAHYGEELERVAAEGALHDHKKSGDAYEKTKKDLHYRRYLLLHHKPGAARDGDRP